MTTNTKITELGRVQVSESIEAIVGVGGANNDVYIISKFVTSPTYTGWAKGGIAVPADMLPEFLRLFGTENLKYALEEVNG